MIGLVIMGLILVPLFALMVASAFGPQRSPRVTAMFTGSVLLLIIAMIAGMAVFAFILGFIVP